MTVKCLGATHIYGSSSKWWPYGNPGWIYIRSIGLNLFHSRTCCTTPKSLKIMFLMCKLHRHILTTTEQCDFYSQEGNRTYLLMTGTSTSPPCSVFPQGIWRGALNPTQARRWHAIWNTNDYLKL